MSKSNEHSIRRNPVAEILPEGKGNAVNAQHLADTLGFDSVRELQREIARERTAGAVILSTCESGGGYYRPGSTQEVQWFVRTLENRAKNTFKALQSSRTYLEQQEMVGLRKNNGMVCDCSSYQQWNGMFSCAGTLPHLDRIWSYSIRCRVLCGEKYGVTFMIVVHTNKQSGIWGRKRFADSADKWDIARSVLIAGEAKDGLRYISHEKSNYGPQGSTVLYRLDSGTVKFQSYTDKNIKIKPYKTQ